jgi:ribonuclease Y
MGIALGTGSVISLVFVLVAVAAGAMLHRLRTERERLRTAAEREVREIRADLERREQRLADREARIDAESEHLHTRRRELTEEREALERRRAEVIRIEDERRVILERVASYTAVEARTDLVRPRAGRGAGPPDRRHRDPAGGRRADRRIRGLRAPPARRRHERPHHRP